MGTIRLILGFGAVAAAIVFGIAVIPPYFANYQFEDMLKNEALAATYSARSEEDIKGVILKKAKDLDIPLTEKQLKVSRTGTSGAGTLTISADYTIPVSLPGFETKLEFHPSSTNKGVF
jgi:hypothetical protein